jgi:uncharacterized membrane protein HdeD (DUF308 family)
MKTENEGLESKIETESRLGHHIIYASIATVFTAGAIMSGIGAHHVEEVHRSWLAVMSGYSGMLAGLTFVWWYNDFGAYRKSKPL